MKWKKTLTYLGVVLLIVGGGVAVFWPSNHFRMYDANLRPLAMTEQEAWCVGAKLSQPVTQSPQPGVAGCIADSDRDAEPNVAMVERWFCAGVNASWGMPMSACLTALDSYGFWPLLEGGLTREWNDAWPRPSIQEYTLDTGRRAGERDTENRGFE